MLLANRANLQARRLHERIATRLRGSCETVWRRRAEPGEPGPYRVVGEVTPRRFLGIDAYPTDDARIEIGFRLETEVEYEHYWCTWIEPDRGLAVGWHQDGSHEELGSVHLQLDSGDTVIERQAATFIDAHPLAVVARRLPSLGGVVQGVTWEDGEPVGIEIAGEIDR
ncbi:hypothetical protein [Halonotius roseus]|uniref:hypothetical protein n=1 Tax=Halonotius roseus TaxID=2511997 RepID=UPI001FEC758A|nr:hypothetical protein [Halonotius roseus]